MSLDTDGIYEEVEMIMGCWLDYVHTGTRPSAPPRENIQSPDRGVPQHDDGDSEDEFLPFLIHF